MGECETRIQTRYSAEVRSDTLAIRWQPVLCKPWAATFLPSTQSTTVRLRTQNRFSLARLTVTGNHTAYKQVKGTKTTAAELEQLYEGLRQSNLTNFDVLLTGYVPSAEAVRAVGKIGRDIKFNAGTKPGSFFWGTSCSHKRLMSR